MNAFAAFAKYVRIYAAAAAVTAVTVIAFGVGAVPAGAHHSFTAEFDEKKPIKLTGKVTKMEWSNPHAWIFIEVTGADGKAVNWALETGNANQLIRNGFKKEDLPVGTLLVVEGWQARNGTATANVNSVTFKDGRRLWAGTSNSAAPQPAQK